MSCALPILNILITWSLGQQITCSNHVMIGATSMTRKHSSRVRTTNFCSSRGARKWDRVYPTLHLDALPQNTLPPQIPYPRKVPGTSDTLPLSRTVNRHMLVKNITFPQLRWRMVKTDPVGLGAFPTTMTYIKLKRHLKWGQVNCQTHDLYLPNKILLTERNYGFTFTFFEHLHSTILIDLTLFFGKIIYWNKICIFAFWNCD